MPTPTARAFKPSYSSQIGIESLIAAPLIAASKANVVMVRGQTRALLENCFDKEINQKTSEATYRPLMVNMTLSRSFIERIKADPQDLNSTEITKVNVVNLAFAVPLLCLVPINNLAVDTVDVDFDLEITSSTYREAKTGLADADPVIERKTTLNGKVTDRSGEKGSKEEDDAARLKVNIHAGPLPLPQGLLTVLDLYTKSIQPLNEIPFQGAK